MTFFFLAVTTLAVATSWVNAQTCPYGNVTRSEWRTLSRSAKQEFLGAVLSLQDRRNSGFSYYDELMRVHNDFGSSGIHHIAQFLPWHRYFIWVYENSLQDILNKGIGLPYWDWSKDSQAPENGPVWGDDTLSFGRNGARDGCVRSGAFNGFMTVYPTRDCLRRNFVNGRLGSFPTAQALNATLSRARDYDDFRSRLETVHDSVHTAIGGNMGFFYSPSDPIFYLHHANIDRIWDMFQKAQPNINNYNGAVQINGQLYQASDADILVNYQARVRQLMNTNRLCYKYAPTSSLDSPTTPVLVGGGAGGGRVGGRVGGGNEVGEDIEKYVRALESSEPINLTAYDRTNIFHTHIPQPLPSEWLRRNKVNETLVRSIEAEMQQDIIAANIGKIPKDAIWRDDEALRKYLAASAGGASSSGGGVVVVSIGKYNLEVNLASAEGDVLVYFRTRVFEMVKALAVKVLGDRLG